MPSIPARPKQVFVSLTGKAFKQARVCCLQAWAVYLDSKWLCTTHEIRNATYVLISIHIHTSAVTQRVKLPCFFCRVTDRLCIYPSYTSIPLGCFHNRAPLNEYIQCRFQPSLIFPALCKARSGSPCCFAMWWAAGRTKLAVPHWFCDAALKKATCCFSTRGTQERGKGNNCNKRSFQTRCKMPQCFQSSL